MHAPAIGDWINSYSAGVWQVYRVLSSFYEFRYSLEAPKKQSKRLIVFSKRLVDGRWKAAFRAECCERPLVKPLSPDARKRMESLFAADPDIRSAFEAYVPEPIPLIVNLSMRVPNVERLQSFCEMALADEMAGGVPLDRVLLLLKEAGLSQQLGETPFNATLQLVCRDHEVREGEFILRAWSVLPF